MDETEKLPLQANEDAACEFARLLEREDICDSTISLYRWHVRSFLKFLGNKRFDQIEVANEFTDSETKKRSDIDEYLFCKETEEKNRRQHPTGRGIGRRANIEGKLSASYQNLFYSTLRTFYKVLGKHELVRSIRKSRKIKNHSQTPLSAEDIEKLMSLGTARDNFCGVDGERKANWKLIKRNQLLMIFGLSTGFRRSSIAAAKHSDLVLDRKDPYVVLEGKGGKKSQVWLFSGFLDAYKEYITEYGKSKNDCLFTTKHGNPLRPNTITCLIKSMAETAHIPNFQHVSPHKLRHYFGTWATRTYGLPVAQRLLAHESPETTAHYVDWDSKETLMKQDPLASPLGA